MRCSEVLSRLNCWPLSFIEHRVDPLISAHFGITDHLEISHENILSRTLMATVDIPQEVKDALRKFRFQRRSSGSAAIVIKINKPLLKMEVEEQYDSISIEELAEELPGNSPRYVVLSYELKHKDGRTSFPLVLINWSPTTSETGMLTLHASALFSFQNTADVSKVIEIRDGSEALTKEEIDAKLAA